MVTWKEFTAAEPDLAAIGRSLLFQFKVGLAFLATVRRDGAPRLHPVCPVLSDDLSLCSSPHSLQSGGICCGTAFPGRWPPICPAMMSRPSRASAGRESRTESCFVAG